MKRSVLATVLAAASALCLTAAVANAKDYRFVLVPKVVHPWFDLVHDGANDAAAYLKKTAGANVKVDYLAPQQANVVEQNEILDAQSPPIPMASPSTYWTRRPTSLYSKKR